MIKLIKYNKYWLLANLICFIPFVYFSSWFWVPSGYDGSPVGIGDFMVMGITLFPIGLLCFLIDGFWLYRIIRNKKNEERRQYFLLFFCVIVAWVIIMAVNYSMRFDYYVP